MSDDDTNTQSTRVSASRRDITPRKVLLPQDERSADERFEGPEEVWSMQVSVDIEASSSEEVEAIEKTVAPPILERLMSADIITRTRLTDCEKKLLERGACSSV